MVTITKWLGNNMKYSYKTIMGMACLIAMPYCAHAQNAGEDIVSEAVDILKGKTTGRSSEWAVATLMGIEDKERRPVAQNALGVAYLKGIGVTQDSTLAVRFFEESARLGNKNANYNLGMMHKNAPRGRQDFAKAVKYFEAGAKQGSLACSYSAGYMYYKGLGCRQDYSRAVEYFKQDVKGLSPSSQYMLGLCYRNGFGVEQNDEKADDHLQKASMANYQFAIEETLRENAEVEESILLSDKDEYVPSAMPEVEPFINADSDLTGNYKGILVTYDWSGNQIIKEELLDASFSKVGDGYYGVWIQGADTIAVKASLATDGKLLFADSRMLIHDRYTEGKKLECVFDDASLALVGPSLTGGLRMYSLTDKEPMRPMYLSLSKLNAGDVSNDSYRCAMSAYPVPGTGQVEVRFLLPKDVKAASITLTDQSGLYVKSYNLGSLNAGQQRFSITTNLKNGLYIVNMKAEEYQGQATILLNR